MITRRTFTAAAAAGLAISALPLGHAAFAQPADPGGRQTYLFFVYTDPVPGQEAAYAKWFGERSHMSRMKAMSGVVSAEHFTDAHAELRHTPIKTPQDMVLYTITTDRPQAVAATVAKLAASGDAWPAATVATVQTSTYRAFGPPVQGVGGEPAGAKAGPKTVYTVLAFHNVVQGQDDAFNTWYDGAHLPELLAYPGVTSGQRGVQAPVQFGPTDAQPRYAMSLRIATSDLPTVFAGMLHGGPPSPAIDRANSHGFTYRKVG